MRRRALIPAALLLSCVSWISACVEDDSEYCDAQSEWASASIEYEDEVLEIVNQRRSEGGTCADQMYGPSGPLSADPALRCAARNHSTDMAVRGYFSHDSPEGESFIDRVTEANYTGSPAGENIAAGYTTPADVMAGWMASPGHCSNILEPSHTEIGIGHYAEGNHWTQVMGRN